MEDTNFDLIPFPSDIKTLFILESPCIDELKNEYPCAGKSGKTMSSKILGDNSISFGKLLFDKDERIKNYGVFNSSPFPFEILNDLNENEKKIAELKIIERDQGHLCDHNIYFDYLKSIDKNELVNFTLRYTNRLIPILKESKSIENIVICGYIAQSIYSYLLNIKLPKYLILEEIKECENRKLNHFICNHPRNDNWLFDLTKINI